LDPQRFHRRRFLTGAFKEQLGVKDVTWLDPGTKEMSSEQWTDALAMLLDGRAQPTGIRRKGLDRTLLLMINAHHESIGFMLPSVPGGEERRLLIDTDQPLRSFRQQSEAGGYRGLV
jgi:isoamylase